MPEVGQLRVEHSIDGATYTLELSGELGLMTAPQLESAVARAGEQGASKLVLDLRRVVFMDSSGLRAVLVLWQQCSARGSEFLVVAGRGPCRRLFEIAGVLDELPLLDTGADGVPPSDG